LPFGIVISAIRFAYSWAVACEGNPFFVFVISVGFILVFFYNESVGLKFL